MKFMKTLGILSLIVLASACGHMGKCKMCSGSEGQCAMKKECSGDKGQCPMKKDGDKSAPAEAPKTP